MGLQVKKTTAAKIRRLLNRGLKINPGFMRTSASYRYDSHVLVNDVEGTYGYPCSPEYLDPVQWEWISFDGPAVVLSANGDPLAIGTSYRAICYGVIESDAGSGSGSASDAEPIQTLVFVCDTAPLGCGLMFTDGRIEVDIDAIAGDGLTLDSDSDCDFLKVNICTTPWTEVSGINSLSVSSGNLVLSLATTTKRLAIVGGKVCHEIVSTSSISTSLALSCKEVVTDVACVSGLVTPTTDDIYTLGDC